MIFRPVHKRAACAREYEHGQLTGKACTFARLLATIPNAGNVTEESKIGGGNSVVGGSLVALVRTALEGAAAVPEITINRS